ncbi:MAG: RNA 2',3'-cyclic phosphodiesterase [Bacteroidia bacterium]|nr:MAG: RNA 2',3'-cyclic phosphodiesterase [Bacteroidia bacterium]
MKRLFCAVKIKPSGEITDAIYHFRESLTKERINWVSPENLHLTLKFFGDTPVRDLDAIVQALQKAASLASPFSFSIKGCGTFGNPRMPRVLWFGIDQPHGLQSLYHTVNKALEPLGYVPDKKVFVPHLTIGRIRHLEDTRILQELLGEYEESGFGKVMVTRFHLFESILRPQGPEYHILENFSL